MTALVQTWTAGLQMSELWAFTSRHNHRNRHQHAWPYRHCKTLAKRKQTIQAQAFPLAKVGPGKLPCVTGKDWKFLDSTRINWTLLCMSLSKMTFFEESPVSKRVWESLPSLQKDGCKLCQESASSSGTRQELTLDSVQKVR